METDVFRKDIDAEPDELFYPCIYILLPYGKCIILVPKLSKIQKKIK